MGRNIYIQPKYKTWLDAIRAISAAVNSQYYDKVIVKDPHVDARAFLPLNYATDGSVDYSIELQAAIDYATDNDLPLYLHDIYGSTAKLTIVRPFNDVQGFTVFGRGRGVSGIKYLGAASIGALLDIDGTNSGWSINNHLSGFKLDCIGAPAGTIGLKINAGIWRSSFDHLYVTRDYASGRTGTGIYMGSGTASDVGCFDNKFSHLYVTHFSKNLHFQGTDASGNTITNCPIDHSYIANGDYNLYAEWFNGLSANNTQYELAQTAGAHFVNGDTYLHMHGAIESPTAGAIGISMDANTKSVIVYADFYNNTGGHFVTNGKVGHFYKTTSSGFIYPPGSEIRMDVDASYQSRIRFLKNGLTDVRLMADNATNSLFVTDENDSAYFKFNITNKLFEVSQTGGLLRLVGTAASPTSLQFFENGIRDVRITPETGYVIGIARGTNASIFSFDVLNNRMTFDGHKIDYNTAAPVAGTYSAGDSRVNSSPSLGSAAGWICTTAGTPGTWHPSSQIKPLDAVSADKGDAAATLTVGTSEPTVIWNTPLTADRAVTLSTTGAYNGAKFRIVRTASSTGAFNLNVGTGPLKALAVGTWCDVEYNGNTAAWMLTAYGAL